MNDGFKVGNGLKQGDGLAPGLSSVALQCVANNACHYSQMKGILQSIAANRLCR